MIAIITLTVTEEQKQYAKHLIETTNFGKRGEFDGNKEQQFIGMLAQTAVADYLGLPRPVPSDKPDGGVDFIVENLSVDVKCMKRHVEMKPHFSHNFYGGQLHFNTDILLFTSFNVTNDILTICGWITKRRFRKIANYYPQGSKKYRDDGSYIVIRGNAGNYEITQNKLNNFKGKEQFFEEMKAIYKRKTGRGRKRGVAK